MKHEPQFKEFLDSEVNLNASRLDTLTDRVEAVNGFLSRALGSFQRLERQGSYALGTIIKPVKDGQEFDADMLVYMKFVQGKSAKEYIDELYDCLKENGTYADKVHRRTRCVQVDYAGDFHLDLVPCIGTTTGEQIICNYHDNAFELTDGTGYRDWFNEKTRITHGNLKRVVRLMKYLRDHKGNFATKSVLLTTLIGNTVGGETDGENFKTVADAVKTVFNRLNVFVQRNHILPEIENPALPGESFTRHWTQKNYDNFRNLIKIYNDKVNKAYASTVNAESLDVWRSLFGDSFGKEVGQASSKTAAVSATIAVTPRKPWAY